MNKMKVFEVRFQMDDNSIFKTYIPAYSNGGAEHRVLDVLLDRCKRCQAFDHENQPIAETLYPGARAIYCTEFGTI